MPNAVLRLIPMPKQPSWPLPRLDRLSIAQRQLRSISTLSHWQTVDVGTISPRFEEEGTKETSPA